MRDPRDQYVRMSRSLAVQKADSMNAATLALLVVLTCIVALFAISSLLRMAHRSELKSDLNDWKSVNLTDQYAELITQVAAGQRLTEHNFASLMCDFVTNSGPLIAPVDYAIDSASGFSIASECARHQMRITLDGTSEAPFTEANDIKVVLHAVRPILGSVVGDPRSCAPPASPRAWDPIDVLWRTGNSTWSTQTIPYYRFCAPSGSIQVPGELAAAGIPMYARGSEGVLLRPLAYPPAYDYREALYPTPQQIDASCVPRIEALVYLNGALLPDYYFVYDASRSFGRMQRIYDGVGKAFLLERCD